MKKLLNYSLSSSSLVFLYLLFPTSATAQISADGTTPTDIDRTGDLIEISGGTEAGSNLFHSFNEFSVGFDETAAFNNADSVANIFSRVTGGNISNIEGLIQANGTANLFLINPAGIIFGENASLNIGGSFLGSTADSIVFPDGEFSATDLDNPPLITINAPIGLRFRDNPGEIINRSFAAAEAELPGRFTIGDPFTAGLQVPDGQTLGLVGGNIFLEGGSLTANEGNIELGAVAGNNTVDIITTDLGFTLGYEGVTAFQDISLFPGAIVDASGNAGGAINLSGRNISLEGETFGSFDSFPVFITSNSIGDGTGETITLNATETVSLSGDFTNISTEAEGSGRAGDVTVNTKVLSLTGGTAISSASFLFDNSQAGNVTINATDLVELSGVTSDFEFNTVIATPGLDTGNGGDITITTNRLSLTEGAQLLASTFGEGDGGNIQIEANSIEVIGKDTEGFFASAILAQVEEGGNGNGGDITIDTAQLTVLEGAQISTAARGEGEGGNIAINASDSIVLNGFSALDFSDGNRSGIFISAEPGATNNAGTLDLTTPQLTIENGARISADNFGTGEGGDANINVDRLTLQDGGTIGAGSLVEADAESNERGAGGSLNINATESVEIIGTGDINGETVNSSLFTLAEGTGDAGDLTLTTQNLSIRDGGNIDGSATGSGSAGELNVTANNLTLDGGAITATTAAGAGGNIGLGIAENITMSNNSLISARAFEDADGGNVNIDTKFIIASPNQNNDILASAEDGVGGNINISAEALFGIEPRNQNNTTNDINASSERNIDGTVSIDTPEINSLRTNTELPRSVVPPKTVVAQGCNADEGIEGQSSFIVSGKGGIPPEPTEPFTIGVIHDGETTAKAPSFEELSQVEDKDLVPARGVVIKEDGGIILTAYPTPGTPGYREYQQNLNCHYQ